MPQAPWGARILQLAGSWPCSCCGRPVQAQKGKAASKAAAKSAAKQGAGSCSQASPAASHPSSAASASTSRAVSIPEGSRGKAKARAAPQVPGADWGEDALGTSPGGRRARRNARRAALDEGGFSH